MNSSLRVQRFIWLHSSQIIFFIMQNESSVSMETDCLSYALICACRVKNLVNKRCAVGFGQVSACHLFLVP